MLQITGLQSTGPTQMLDETYLSDNGGNVNSWFTYLRVDGLLGELGLTVW